MKIFMSLALFSLVGCSHGYISQWDGESVTACCPTEKIFCTESKLIDIAKDRCGGDVKAMGSGTRGTGNYSVNVNKNLFGNYGGVSEQTEKCELFKCSERTPASK